MLHFRTFEKANTYSLLMHNCITYKKSQSEKIAIYQPQIGDMH